MFDVCPCLLGTTSDGESEDNDPRGVSSVTSSDDATETLDADLDANNGPSDIGEVLSFAGRNLDDASLVDLCRKELPGKNISCLDLSSNNIEGAALEQLTNLLKGSKHFQTLRLSDNAIADSYLPYLLPLFGTLSELDLSFNQISSSGIYALFEGRKDAGALMQCNLRDLNLKGNMLADDGAVLLAQALENDPGLNEALRHVDVSINAIEARGVEALLKASSSAYLETLALDDSRPDLASCMQQVAGSRVRKISLRCTAMNDDAACCLAQALALGFGTCQELDLRDNKQCLARGRTALQGVAKMKKGLVLHM